MTVCEKDRFAFLCPLSFSRSRPFSQVLSTEFLDYLFFFPRGGNGRVRIPNPYGSHALGSLLFDGSQNGCEEVSTGSHPPGPPGLSSLSRPPQCSPPTCHCLEKNPTGDCFVCKPLPKLPTPPTGGISRGRNPLPSQPVCMWV